MKDKKIVNIIQDVFDGKDFSESEPFETKKIRAYTMGKPKNRGLYIKLKTPNKTNPELPKHYFEIAFDPNCKCKPCKANIKEATGNAMFSYWISHSSRVFESKILPEVGKIIHELEIGDELRLAFGMSMTGNYDISEQSERASLGVATVDACGFDVSLRFTYSKELANKLLDLYLDTHKDCCRW